MKVQFSTLVSSRFNWLVWSTGNALCSDCKFHTPDNDTTFNKCAQKNTYSGWFLNVCNHPPPVLLFSPMLKKFSDTKLVARWHAYHDALDFIAVKVRPDNFTGESSFTTAGRCIGNIAPIA